MMRFYNKDRNNERIKSLSEALSKRDNTQINTGGISFTGGNNQNNQISWGEGSSNFLTGAGNLYNGIKNSDLFTPKNDGAIASEVRNFVTDTGSSGSPVYDNITGIGSGDVMLDSLGSAGGFNGAPLIGNAIGGIKGFANTGDWKDGVQGIFGTGSNDSDVMQGIKGTANGALTGLSVGGPVGAAIGATLGLGSSFLDDIF